jgi:transposase
MKRKSLEYREYVAKLVVDEGKKMSHLSRELDIPHQSLSRWVNEYKQKIKFPTPKEDYITPTEQKKRDDAYQKRIRELEEENEILKKAMHFFTKKPE